MELRFGQEHWQPGESSSRPQDESKRPDWHELRQRLLAARETWRVLEAYRMDRLAIGSGSFASPAAESLSSYEQELTSVNPTSSGVGNPEGLIDGDAAGISRTSGRG